MGDGTGISHFSSPELLSFWPVLTEAKAGFDSPAVSQQAWEGVPPQAYPARFQEIAKHFTFGMGSLSKSFYSPFQTHRFPGEKLPRTSGTTALYLCPLKRSEWPRLHQAGFHRVVVTGCLALLTQAVTKSLALAVLL